jgi:catechol 1,2-dioxygenase
MYKEYLECEKPLFPLRNPMLRSGVQPTPTDILGPFYKAGAPLVANGVIGEADQFNRLTIHVSGRVLSVDGEPVAGAVLDVWQADSHGVYDNDGYRLRGKVEANYVNVGGYEFQTVMPGDYQIGDEPPEFRCAHIHVIVTASGFKTLTTQLYFADDKYDATDRWFDARRVIQVPHGTFDFVLVPEG